MLSDNLKNSRKSKGLSQNELAIKLNVVRQTVSKWEQGLSVPDSEMLIKIAEELDTSVSALLGETLDSSEDSELKTIAAKLEVLNEQFVKQNEKRQKKWRTIFIVIGCLAIISLFQTIIGFISLVNITNEANGSASIIGGADGPTSVLVSYVPMRYSSVFTTVALSIVAIVGICKTKRR